MLKIIQYSLDNCTLLSSERACNYLECNKLLILEINQLPSLSPRLYTCTGLRLSAPIKEFVLFKISLYYTYIFFKSIFKLNFSFCRHLHMKLAETIEVQLKTKIYHSLSVLH